jgi:hypothetical protein
MLGILLHMDPLIQKRLQILQQMEKITRMERGSLQVESRPSKRHSDCPCGPYYKHQVWEDGHNLTRRVPKEKANALAQAIDGRQQFEKLAEQFVDTTVAMTRAQSSADSKKNATTSRSLFRRKSQGTSSAS